MSDLTIKLRLTGDSKELTGTLRNASGEVTQFGRVVDTSSSAAAGGFATVDDAVQRTDRRIGSMVGTVGRLVGAYASWTAISRGLSAGDDYREMAERIGMATQSTEEFVLVQDRLLATADGTYRRLSEAQELYIRTADALRSLGYETEQQLDITDSLSYSFVVNAASVQRADSAVNAFSRSIQSGRVTADDWQSILAATPTVVDDISRATGMAGEEIRRLGVQGKLGLTDLTEGLRLARDENQRLSDGMNTTVRDAFVRLQNQMQTYLGTSSEVASASSALASGIVLVAENIEELAQIAGVVGIAALSRWTVTLTASTVASIADMRVKQASAAYEVRLAQAQVASTSAALANTTAQGALGAAHTRTAAATAAHEAAVRRLTAAKTASTRVAGGLLRLLGGPAGLALTVGMTATAFLTMGRDADVAKVSLEAMREELAELSIQQLRVIRLEEERTERAAAAVVAQKQAAVDAIQREIDAIDSSTSAWAEYEQQFERAAWAGEGRALDQAIAALQEEEKKLAAVQSRLEEVNSAISDLSAGAARPSSLPSQSREELDAVEKLIEQLAAQQRQLELNERAQLEYQLAVNSATPDQMAAALAIYDTTAALREKLEAEADAKAADDARKESIEQMIDRLDDQHRQVEMNDRAYLKYQLSVEGATNKQVSAALATFDATEKLKAEKDELTKNATAREQWIKQTISAIDPTIELAAEIERIEAALADGLFEGVADEKVLDYLEDLRDRLRELSYDNPFSSMADGLNDMSTGIHTAASAMQSMHKAGSRGYREMAVAMQAANTIAAVGAVLNQGQGDPWTAAGRMVAMAASVASLGYSVGSLGGGFKDDAAARQEKQGTGTVLGDADAKSQSMSAALDITASATSELVGINRAQLTALQAMQNGIGGATVRIAQQSSGLDFDYGGALDGAVNSGQGASILAGAAGGALAGAAAGSVVPIIGTAVGGLIGGVLGGVWGAVSSFLGGSSKITDEGIRIMGGTLEELMEETTVQAFQTTRTKKWAWSKSRSSTAYTDLNDDVGAQFSLVFEAMADSVYAGATALGLSGDAVEKSINEFVIATQQISLKGLSAEDQQKEIEAVFSSIFDGLAANAVDFLPAFQKAGEGLGETLARVATNVQVTEEAIRRLGFSAERLGAQQFAALSIELIELSGGLEQFITNMGTFIGHFAPDAHKFDLAASDMERALAAVGLSVPASRDAMWDLMQTLDAGTDAGRRQIATLLELGATADQYYKMLEEQQRLLHSLIGDEAGGALTQYFADLTDFIAAETKVIEADYRDRMNLLNEQSRVARQLGDYVAQLRLSDLSPYDPGQKLGEASEQFAALLVRAEAGDIEAAQKLQSAADSYLKNADEYFGRTDAYTAVFDDVLGALSALGLELGATSTEDHIAALNEQMLAEQQALRDFASAELDWAVSQYDKLTDIEQLLAALPGDLGSALQNFIAQPDDTTVGMPTRPDGSHRSGLYRVPFDGYRAELHAGERVLTAPEAQQYNNLDMQPVVSELAALRREVAELRAERARDADMASRQRDATQRGIETVARNGRRPVEVLR